MNQILHKSDKLLDLSLILQGFLQIIRFFFHLQRYFKARFRFYLLQSPNDIIPARSIKKPYEFSSLINFSPNFFNSCFHFIYDSFTKKCCMLQCFVLFNLEFFLCQYLFVVKINFLVKFFEIFWKFRFDFILKNLFVSYFIRWYCIGYCFDLSYFK